MLTRKTNFLPSKAESERLNGGEWDDSHSLKKKRERLNETSWDFQEKKRVWRIFRTSFFLPPRPHLAAFFPLESCWVKLLARWMQLETISFSLWVSVSVGFLFSDSISSPLLVNQIDLRRAYVVFSCRLPHSLFSLEKKSIFAVYRIRKIAKIAKHLNLNI